MTNPLVCKMSKKKVVRETFPLVLLKRNILIWTVTEHACPAAYICQIYNLYYSTLKNTAWKEFLPFWYSLKCVCIFGDSDLTKTATVSREPHVWDALQTRRAFDIELYWLSWHFLWHRQKHTCFNISSLFYALTRITLLMKPTSHSFLYTVYLIQKG